MRRIFLATLVLVLGCSGRQATEPKVLSAVSVQSQIDTLLVRLNWLLVDCKKVNAKCLIVSVKTGEDDPQHLWRVP